MKEPQNLKRILYILSNIVQPMIVLLVKLVMVTHTIVEKKSVEK